MSGNDRSVLRRLAEERAEIAALPVQAQRRELWRRLNDLEPVRPLVWVNLNEIPWDELADEPELRLQTADPVAREIETSLRRELYRWKYLPGDMVVENEVWSPVALHSTGLGMQVKADRSATGGVAGQGAARYHCQFQTEADVEKIRFPELSCDEAETQRHYELRCEVFAGLAPVVKRIGALHSFRPWDELIQWWGTQPAMLDLVLRPQLVHLALERLLQARLHEFRQLQSLGLLALNNGNLNTGAGGLSYTRQLPQPGFDPAHVRPVDLWADAAAQIFSEVSPAMHEEFALRYERPWLEQFGLSNYGCCEPLHHKVQIARSIRNLRKISMNYRADLVRGAEQVGRDYVFSYKPNPAVVAEDGWHPQLARRWIREAVEITRGLNVEIILKDITTVRGDPRRLWAWTRIAQEEAERIG